MIRAVKRGVELVTARTGLLGLIRRFRSPPPIILSYHNIVEPGTGLLGDQSLHLPRDRFGEQLDALVATHEVLSLESFRNRLVNRAGKPPAVVSFDDAYRGTVTHGVAELEERSLPATLFVSPGTLGDEAFWWDSLADPSRGGPDPVVRAEAIRSCGGRNREVLQWARARNVGSRHPPAVARSATDVELRAALRYDGLTVGSHGWDHASLPDLEADDRRRQLDESLRWIRELHPTASIPWLACPYGNFSPAVAEEARDLGYDGVLLATGGALPEGSGAESYVLPRLNVPRGLSLEGFRLRTAGLLAR